ncbi:translocator protein-like [Homalodisca vitripennis]|nr:translocator protein-like [Homalodisca vitripennis]XP_046667098.1 translocator protein-like [Homalodisca vitripennis]KAG8302644.1 hypothetical protein J6590_028562 [Homalodisca vitripennis]
MSIPWPMVGAVALPLASGSLSGYLVREGTRHWYESLKKPDWKPPKIAFSIVWPALYSGMGYASYLVWKEGGGFHGAAQLPLAAYGTQLALNVAWSPIFFGKKSIKGGLITIGLLDAAVVATTYMFYQVTPTAAYIMLPYLAWLVYATALNHRVWRDNPRPSITEVKGQ